MVYVSELIIYENLVMHAENYLAVRRPIDLLLTLGSARNAGFACDDASRAVGCLRVDIGLRRSEVDRCVADVTDTGRRTVYLGHVLCHRHCSIAIA